MKPNLAPPPTERAAAEPAGALPLRVLFPLVVAALVWAIGALVSAVLLGALFVLAPAPALADAPVGLPSSLGSESQIPLLSPHARELATWHRREAEGWVPWIEPHSRAPGPRRLGMPHPDREVHGWHPYWMGSAYTGYDWALLTTVAFFSLELDGGGSITDGHGWPAWSGLVSAAHEHGVRAIVTGSLFSTSVLRTLLSSVTNRHRAVMSLVTAAQSGGADGINIDFEGVPGDQKQNLVAFVDELRAALSAAIAGSYLSIATPAVDWADGYDYDQLAARCDHLTILAYDYHWQTSPTTGPVAPLAGWGTYNVAWTVQDYLQWGAPPNKMLLGVPYYGYRWPSESGDPGASTTAAGAALTYQQAIGEAETYGVRWDAPSSTPWYRYQTPEWRQGWFDNAQSLSAKYDFILSENLAGVGIWALGYDGARPELWGALDDHFGSGAAALQDIARAGSERDPATWAAAPNPFSTRLDFSGSLTEVEIYDARGRIVRSLSGGGNVRRWDGRDDAGRSTASGIYFARRRVGGQAIRLIRLSPSGGQ